MIHTAIICAGRAGYRLLGRRNIGSHRLGHLLAPLMPVEPTPVSMGGYVLALDLRHPGDLIRSWGIWEPGLNAWLRKSLKPGMTFVDVGAHHGTYTMLAAHLVGPLGHVFAFEPFPSSADLIEHSARLNGFDNVTLVRAAAGDTTGPCRITTVGPHVIEEGGLAVDMKQIDDHVCAADIVKIDTDGAEDRVLAGMRKLIAAGTQIVVEVSDFGYQSFAESYAKVAEMLAGERYRPRIIRRDGSTSNFEPGRERLREAHLVFSR
jgi:FkbM family methyltransferase